MLTDYYKIIPGIIKNFFAKQFIALVLSVTTFIFVIESLGKYQGAVSRVLQVIALLVIYNYLIALFLMLKEKYLKFFKKEKV